MKQDIKKTLVGLHIPKCAGTSILNMAQQNLPAEQIYQNTSFHKNFAQGRPEFFEIRNTGRLRFVWGHFIHEEMLKYFENPFIFTYLREPRERLISNFLFMQRLRAAQKKPQLDWENWIKSTGRNPVCHFIIRAFPELAGSGDLLKKSQNVLNIFDFVGLTESFDKTSSEILSILNISPKVAKSNTTNYNGEVFEIPEKIIDIDLKLYSWAKERFSQKVDLQFEPDEISRRQSFLSEPKRDAVLRSWLARALAQEYADFSISERGAELHNNAAKWHLEVLDAIKGSK